MVRTPVIKFDGAGTGAVVEAVFKKLYLQDLLLDTSSSQTMYIESTVPTFNMKETDADLNEKFWRLQTSAGVFKVDAVNDAYDTAATAYSVDRTGVTPNLHIWYSNASEAMRVTSAGNVGIRTSTPVTALDVNGTITGTTGNITTVNATTVDTTNIEVTNIKAKDGTASATIANSTGVMTVASSVLTTTDINGGTIDGVTIGGASAGAGTFTSITGTSLDMNGAIEVSGGIYVGGTAAANLLDDYEEGTWTPAFTPQTGALGSITYSIQAGNYTKVGRQVTVTGRLQTTGSVTIGTASGAMRISGLPFAVGVGEAFYSAATLTYVESWTAGDAPSSAYVDQNANQMTIRIRNAGSDGTENTMIASEFVSGADGGCSLMFSATYFTA
jgi:hypothetical protein